MSSKEFVGITDSSIQTLKEDKFNVQKYITGLSEFIQACNTPMTIAIQGDWGSGKTSFMNLIRGDLEANSQSKEHIIHTVWFNTWQYSQFDMAEQLSVSLMSNLVEGLLPVSSTKDSLTEAIKKIAGFTFSAGKEFLRIFSGYDLNKVELPGSAGTDVGKMNLIQEVQNLRDLFSKAVNETIEQAGARNGGRVVVFIDDLDRLQPERAVELLEVLKLFLECDNCVFVLAIDYEVVLEGVKKKYGDFMDRKKGRSFFDKIIQVPFVMPVSQYNIDKYIEKQLLAVDLKTENAADFTAMIQNSIGHNPRAMKRLLNTFFLQKKIFATDLKESNQDTFDQRALFALLCMQMSFEDAYHFLAINRSDIDKHFFENLSNFHEIKHLDVNKAEQREEGKKDIAASKRFTSTFLAEMEHADENVANHENFVKSFLRFITYDKSLDDKDIEKLKELLGNTTISSLSIGEGRARRYKKRHFDAQWISLDSDIREINGDDEWASSTIEKFRYLDEEYEVESYSDLLRNVCMLMYNKHPAKYTEVANNAKDYGLASLFKGKESENYSSPISLIGVPPTPFIEGKTGTNYKMRQIGFLLEAVDCPLSNFSCKVVLAESIL